MCLIHADGPALDHILALAGRFVSLLMAALTVWLVALVGVELGDAWVPFLLGVDEVSALLTRARDRGAFDARGTPLDVGLWPEPVLDVIADPGAVRDQAAEHIEAGATILNYRFPSRSVTHYLEQLEALTEILDLDWDREAP